MGWDIAMVTTRAYNNVDTFSPKRWFAQTIQPKQVVDESGTPIREGSIVPNPFWTSRRQGITIKAKSRKVTKKDVY